MKITKTNVAVGGAFLGGMTIGLVFQRAYDIGTIARSKDAVIDAVENALFKAKQHDLSHDESFILIRKEISLIQIFKNNN